MTVADEVLPGLKEFQRRTVEHVFRRLYTDPDSTRRFLVADEVGLGKTMVARGVVAKAIDHLRAEGNVKRIDVIYVCSNQVIARQNISKLRVSGEEHDPVLDRVTMLPAHLSDLDQHEINLIPLTPQTSLDLRSQVGARRERVVLWHLLARHFGERFMLHTGPRRVLQGPCKTLSSFDWGLRWDPEYWSEPELDRGLSDRFVKDLLRFHKTDPEDSLLERFERLAHSLRRRERHQRNSWELGSQANHLVGALRGALASSCIAAQEPDLVILDEFQRFRNLISPDDPTGELARMLFKHEDARVLMLSATPYKMFTRDAESEEDHHQDFLHTLDFLMDHDGVALTKCEGQLRDIRTGLRTLPEGREAALKAKKALERRLRKVMARTERLAVGSDRNGMVEVIPCEGLELTKEDVFSFRELDRVARAIGHPDIVEYWKSSPYPLNFMDDYVFTRDFEAAAPTQEDARLRRGALDAEAVRRFDEIDLGNARLRSLTSDTVGKDLWKLLWLPPSMPYYRAGAPFAQFEGENPTKRLVFSAWSVVPKAISLMLSYEAERKLVALGEETRENTAEARKAINQQLRIAKNAERTGPATMTTLALLMPSRALAYLADPLAILRARGGELPSVNALLKETQQALRPVLRTLTKGADKRPGDRDTAWYVAVPLLLEAERVGKKAMVEWLRSDELAGVISPRRADVDPDTGAWSMHLEEAVSIVADPTRLGKPPLDLLEVTALLAVGSPAMTALRSLYRIAPESSDDVSRTAAVRVADAMRGVFNWPEVIPLIRATDRTARYWEDALRYSVNGNLQAVLDEFAHVLSEWAPIPNEKDPDDYVAGVSEGMLNSLALHGTDYEVREINEDGVPTNEKLRMRPRFAIRFSDPRASEDKQVDRATNVRASFNSPFWPFVLASTSVGQEGLDFHLYCHAIVHWNLPSNPVDFEQREGRIHRYKGHAIRLNAAAQHGQKSLSSEAPDLWKTIFASAGEADGGLRPYWILDGDARIQRYVPALPLSRDKERERLLGKLLASYRLAFGQPRQDDLLAYLGRLDLDAELVNELTINLQP